MADWALAGWKEVPGMVAAPGLELAPLFYCLRKIFEANDFLYDERDMEQCDLWSVCSTW